MEVFTDKFIAFVDVLGFKNLVVESENGTGIPLPALLQLVKRLGTGEERAQFERHGPICCPGSSYKDRNLDFRVTQISDCAVISAELSPAGAINLIHHCWTATMLLLLEGIMCRGYINRGSIYHSDNQVIGSGYQTAFKQEKGVSAFKQRADERGTPFVAIDRDVVQYVENSEDKCVKEMFSRFVKSDGNTAALFPFHALSHSFLVTADHPFNAERELRANKKVRERLSALKNGVTQYVDSSNLKAVEKAQHYLKWLDVQLAICDETDEIITSLSAPILGEQWR